MLYLFQDTESGEFIELSMPMAAAPPLGSLVEHEGRTLKRRASMPQVLVEPDLRHVARTLRARQHTPEHLQKHVPHWERTGSGLEFPRFDTKSEIAEYEARSEGAFHYDHRPKIQKSAALAEST